MSVKINIMALIVSMPVGGVETQLLSIARRLNKQKYNVSICCIKELGDLGETAAEIGIETNCLNLKKIKRFSLSIPGQISKVLKENDINILWTHQYIANLYGRMASLLAGTPGTVSTFHALYDNRKLHRSIFNYVLSKRSVKLVAVSESVASDMKSYDHVTPDKIKVIYNGIDLSLFDVPESKAECRRKLGLSEKDIIVGAIGRISEEKNHKAIINALNKLPSNVKGVVIGDGPLRDTLKEAGGERCFFAGQMENSLIPVALKAFDIFCFPSLWEGFGVSLIEAMASGIPIVASDISTHREVLGGAGILFSLDKADELPRALRRLIDDPDERKILSEKGRKRARIYSIDNTVKAYEEIFDRIMKKTDR